MVCCTVLYREGSRRSGSLWQPGFRCLCTLSISVSCAPHGMRDNRSESAGVVTADAQALAVVAGVAAMATRLSERTGVAWAARCWLERRLLLLALALAWFSPHERMLSRTCLGQRPCQRPQAQSVVAKKERAGDCRMASPTALAPTRQRLCGRGFRRLRSKQQQQQQPSAAAVPDSARSWPFVGVSRPPFVAFPPWSQLTLVFRPPENC